MMAHKSYSEYKEWANILAKPNWAVSNRFQPNEIEAWANCFPSASARFFNTPDWKMSIDLMNLAAETVS